MVLLVELLMGDAEPTRRLMVDSYFVKYLGGYRDQHLPAPLLEYYFVQRAVAFFVIAHVDDHYLDFQM